MKKILLVYPPFCTPASPPYSIHYLRSFLLDNCHEEIEILDLNIEFHTFKFPEYKKYYKDNKQWDDYEEVTLKYKETTERVYSENNKKVIQMKNPEYFDELLNKIMAKKPDIVAFSVVYSSQAFYTYALLKALKDTITIIGGPAVNEKLMSVADHILNNEIELLEFITEEKIDHDKINFKTIPDFSSFDMNVYFTPQPVIPLKTSTTCYYKKCTFCTHFAKVPYAQLQLDIIKETIIQSKQKYFFLIDDMIPTQRLLNLAEAIEPLNVFWSCQLKPVKSLDLEKLKRLRKSGLVKIMWGVESGNDRILQLMDKGTNKKDIEKVLKASHDAGIKNVTYLILGFPSETKEEAYGTIKFLKENSGYIDLISMSIFGLQYGTPIYKNPEHFGITRVIEEERTVLGRKITYEVSEGITPEKANSIRRKNKGTFERINKYPSTMNFFREHMLCLLCSPED